jgi:hypothetical protein
MRETKVTDKELNWLYSASFARQPIDPSHLMINWWCCDIEFGRYRFEVLPLHVGYLIKTGYYKEPKHLLPGTSLGFEYMKQDKYISGDERGGFKVAKVNLLLLDSRLRLFIQGKEDWLEEGLLMPVSKIKEKGL